MTQSQPNIDRIRKFFRNEANINAYSPLRHMLINFSLLIGSIFIYITQLEDVRLQECWPIPLVLILGNLVVFIVHKYPLHTRYRFKWNAYAYKNHTLRHHRFFNDQNMTFLDRNDWFSVFFPTEVVIGFILVYHSLSYFLLKLFLSTNEVSLFLAASSGYFLLYEFVHYTSHLPDSHLLLKCKWLKAMKRHHQIHHDPRLMNKYNFCIVYPLFDYIFSTKYKE